MRYFQQKFSNLKTKDSKQLDSTPISVVSWKAMVNYKVEQEIYSTQKLAYSLEDLAIQSEQFRLYPQTFLKSIKKLQEKLLIIQTFVNELISSYEQNQNESFVLIRVGFILGTIYIVLALALYSWLFLVLYFEKQGMEQTFREGLLYSLWAVYLLAALVFVSSIVMFLGVSNYQKNSLLFNHTLKSPENIQKYLSQEDFEPILIFSKQCFQTNQTGNIVSGFFPTNTKHFYYLDGISRIINSLILYNNFIANYSHSQDDSEKLTEGFHELLNVLT